MEILKGKYYRTKGTNKDIVLVISTKAKRPGYPIIDGDYFYFIKRMSDSAVGYFTETEFFTYIQPLPISNQQVAQILYGNKGEVRNEN